MKRILSVAALTALAINTGIIQAEAADVTAAVDANSAYVWRGLTFNDGLVLQPSLDVAANGFDINVWGNFDLNDYNGVDSGDFSEVDLTGSYSHSFGPVEATVGIIDYLFPGGGDSTAELFAGLSMDVGAGFSVGSTVYYDFDQVDDFYVTATLGYSYSINKPTTLGFSGTISYAGKEFADFYAGGTDAGFFNYILTASLNYAVTDALGIGVAINYSDSMDKDVLPDDAVDTNFFGGIHLSYSF